MNILVKFPTRSRPERFLQMLSMYVDSCENKDMVDYLVSIDADDVTMTDSVCGKAMVIAKDHIKIVRGMSPNKIHACNRDMDDLDPKYQILVLASDDMQPMVQGWDRIICEQMAQQYPDTDGCLWFYDGHQNRICTMNIMGRKYYDELGYIYHPSYLSLWCDNEYTDVATAKQKISYYNTCLFRHIHPMWESKKEEMDELYRANESYFKRDQINYNKRKALGFPK